MAMTEKARAGELPTWSDNKRFHTWNHEMRERFGAKVMKVMLDAGFTCPNRDGSIATGGCTFCRRSPRAGPDGGPATSPGAGGTIWWISSIRSGTASI